MGVLLDEEEVEDEEECLVGLNSTLGIFSSKGIERRMNFDCTILYRVHHEK